MKDKENVKFLTIPLIVSGCLRVVPSSSDLICKNYNFRSHLEFNSLNIFGFKDYNVSTRFYHV